jgi:acetyl esterase/lipase
MRRHLLVLPLLTLALALPASAVDPVAAHENLPKVHTTLPPNWAPGLDKEIAGIKPLLLNLWDGEAPNTVNDAKPERDDGTGRIWDVNAPGMIVYLPPKDKAQAAGGTCIIACMGGSYTHLTRLVGADNTVEPLTSQGIAVVALKYRLKPPSIDPERDATLDAQRAIRLVRAHAKEWNIDPAKIGMLGWSAGGNLCLSTATKTVEAPSTAPAFEQFYSGRPNFVVMWSPWPNGKTADAYPVPRNAPPAILGTAQDDRTAPATFAQAIKASWEKAGAPVTYVDIEKGGHGAFSLGNPPGTDGSAGNWVAKNLLPWLSQQNLWKNPAP